MKLAWNDGNWKGTTFLDLALVVGVLLGVPSVESVLLRLLTLRRLLEVEDRFDESKSAED